MNQPPLSNANNGCSCAPDLNIPICCDQHDRAYYLGGSKDQRKRADDLFRQCVRAKGHGVLDDVYNFGTRMGGVPWLPTPFRRGFGYPSKKGHRGSTPHSEQPEKILNE